MLTFPTKLWIWLFHVVVWPSTVKKCTKIYNPRAGPLFFSLYPIVLWSSRCHHRNSFVNSLFTHTDTVSTIFGHRGAFAFFYSIMFRSSRSRMREKQASIESYLKVGLAVNCLNFFKSCLQKCQIFPKSSSFFWMLPIYRKKRFLFPNVALK